MGLAAGVGLQPVPQQGPCERQDERQIYLYALLSVVWHIPPELPAADDPLLGDDETRGSYCRSRCSRLWPHRSPVDVALLPTFQCTAEGSVTEASHTPHARYPFPRKVPRQPTLRAFGPLRRALLSTRAPSYPPGIRDFSILQSQL